MSNRQIRHSFWSPEWLAFVALTLLVGPAFAADDKHIAQTFAKAATYIYFSSFEQDPVLSAFSEDELEILSAHLESLNVMIRDALGIRHSVGGAMLMAHFGLRENMDYLRSHVIQAGRTYGWEGSYVDDEERFYSDGQYVYHSIYLAAFEKLTNEPLHKGIELSSRERERILELAATPGHESHHWAIWIGRKFELF